MLSNSQFAGGITDSNFNNRTSVWKLHLYNIPAGAAPSLVSRFSADPLLKIYPRGLVITSRHSSITTTAAGRSAGSEPERLLVEELQPEWTPSPGTVRPGCCDCV